VLPIREAVVFPGTLMPLQVNRARSKRVLDLALAGSRIIACVMQRNAEVDDPKLDDLYRIGTACLILKMYKMPDGSETIIVHGLRRVGIESVSTEPGYLLATVHPYNEPAESSTEQKALVHTIRAAADRIIELSPNIPDEARQVLQSIQRPGALADFLAANLSLSAAYRQELLETLDLTERLRKINYTVAAQLDVVELSNKIQEQVHSQVDKSQREYYLREQLKAIQQELGEGGAPSAKAVQLRDQIKRAKMPKEVEKEADRELERLEAIPQASPEYSMTLDYLDWLVELPWSVSTEDNLDIERAQRTLDDDHYGLSKVKKRIIEFLAVCKLKKDSRGSILCFAGPLGVGKTSLG
jgi:ATP-dependent Lon protease